MDFLVIKVRYFYFGLHLLIYSVPPTPYSSHLTRPVAIGLTLPCILPLWSARFIAFLHPKKHFFWWKSRLYWIWQANGLTPYKQFNMDRLFWGAENPRFNPQHRQLKASGTRKCERPLFDALEETLPGKVDSTGPDRPMAWLKIKAALCVPTEQKSIDCSEKGLHKEALKRLKSLYCLCFLVWLSQDFPFTSEMFTLPHLAKEPGKIYATSSPFTFSTPLLSQWLSKTSLDSGTTRAKTGSLQICALLSCVPQTITETESACDLFQNIRWIYLFKAIYWFPLTWLDQ